MVRMTQFMLAVLRRQAASAARGAPCVPFAGEAQKQKSGQMSKSCVFLHFLHFLHYMHHMHFLHFLHYMTRKSGAAA